MALSSRPKSSSSASKAPKPTYRRASSSSGKPAAGARAAAAGKRPIAAGKRTAVVKPAVAKSAVAKPAAVKRAVPKKAVALPASKAYAASKPLKGSKASKPSKAVKAPKMAQVPKAAPQVLKPTKQKRTRSLPGFLKPVAGFFSGIFSALGRLFSRLPLPRLSRGVLLSVVGGVAVLALVMLVVANSGLFAATDIQVRATEHIDQETAEALIKVPDGTTLFNVNEGEIVDSLKASPWASGVDIQREWPHTLVITPVERTIKAIAYITADDIAWAIDEEGTWVAPVSLVVAVDAEGNEVALTEDGAIPEGATQLAGVDAALKVAQRDNALLLIDVPSDVTPKSGDEVTSEVVLAGLTYAKEFSAEFVAQIKDLSVASVESISVNLLSGVEVSLGSPENITEKERVVTKLLAEQQGVTYINVREPGAYTFRSAPQ